MLQKELEVAVQAVRQSCLLTKKIQTSIIEHKDKTTLIKSDSSPVTIGDYAAQAVIINCIKSNFPEDEIVGEESSSDLSDEFLEEILSVIKHAQVDYEKNWLNVEGVDKWAFTNEDYPLKNIKDLRKVINMGNCTAETGKRRYWCIDPIDGTKGFLRGEQFAICLALIDSTGESIIGVNGCPNLVLSNYSKTVKDIKGHENFGYIYKASKGQGTHFKVASDGSMNGWERIYCQPHTLENISECRSLEGVEKTHSAHGLQQQLKDELHVTETVRLDSNVKYCMLAHGLGDLYLRLPRDGKGNNEKIWDHASGNVIVKEAGGYHTDAINNKTLRFNTGRIVECLGIIASGGNSDVHARVVKAASKALQG